MEHSIIFALFFSPVSNPCLLQTWQELSPILKLRILFAGTSQRSAVQFNLHLSNMDKQVTRRTKFFQKGFHFASLHFHESHKAHHHPKYSVTRICCTLMSQQNGPLPHLGGPAVAVLQVFAILLPIFTVLTCLLDKLLHPTYPFVKHYGSM